LAAACVPALAAYLFYLKTGAPGMAGNTPAPRTAIATPGHAEASAGADAASGGAAGSMDEAVARLEARVAGGQASDSDWTLLAQSYEFLGRTEEAAKARQHQVPASGGSAGPAPVPAAEPVAGTAIGRAQAAAAQLEDTVRRNPKDATAWFSLAQSRRTARDFEKANEAYDKALGLDPRNADAWADYADSLASSGGRTLAGKPAKAIERALALNPNHVKALWLAASLSLEQKKYADALAQWQRLRAVLPPNSPDASIIDSNISEARALAGQPAGVGVRQQAAAPTSTAAAVEGSVEVSPALKAQVAAGMTLFIYAKTADGKGPPLAVLRQSAGGWPVRFRLDDSQAMMPGRNLSSVDEAQLEARLSRSGNAITEKGDLVAPAQRVKVRGAKALRLVIDKVAG
ncbi:MAG: c-type cytochrome biosis protein CcmI, partial [Pseudomonadota bacterium]